MNFVVVYYYSIIISLIAHNYHLSKSNKIIILGLLIISLDLMNIFLEKKTEL